jgi:hypothetical protein
LWLEGASRYGERRERLARRARDADARPTDAGETVGLDHLIMVPRNDREKITVGRIRICACMTRGSELHTTLTLSVPPVSLAFSEYSEMHAL